MTVARPTAEASAGFRTIGADRGLTVVTLAASVQTLVAGASGVFMVVMAAEVLGTGPRGVGFLDAVLGVGAILGGLLAISRAAKGRLGVDLVAGVVLWSLPLLLVTPTQLPSVVKAELQRLGPDRVFILGGTGVVSGTVVNAIDAALP